jgi:threonine 3-dehydrogenase
MMHALVKKDKKVGAYYCEVPDPTPKHGEIKIDVKAAAICGTDVHYYYWDQAAENFANSFSVEFPLTLGHEFAGTIVEIGPGVTDKKIGDRVAIETHIPCGKCFQCDNGDAHNCMNMGVYGTTCNGAFAEYAIAPANVAFILADNIGFEEGALFEPAGVAMRGIEEAKILPGDTVLIYGCGPIALMAIQMAQVCGASQVIAVDINEFRVQMAQKLGAIAINAQKQDIGSTIREIAGAKGGVDAVLELTGSPVAYQNIFDLIRLEGRLITIGHPAGEIPVNVTRNINLKGLSVKGIFGRRIWSTWWHLTSLVASRKIDILDVVTHRFKYDQHEEAFAKTRGDAGKILFVK